MNSEAVVIAIFVVVVFGGAFGSVLYQDWAIANSKDPLATACAMGKDKACTALANRKP